MAGNLGVHVTEFNTTAANKGRAIQAARLLVERGAVKCGEPRLLRALKGSGWEDHHHDDAFMAFVILCAHLPLPSRTVAEPWDGPPIAEPMKFWEPRIRRPDSVLLRMRRRQPWGW